MPVLEVDGLSISYKDGDRRVHALRDVSISVGRGEVVGLVGETGCGKSTLAHAALGELGPGGRLDGGQVLFDGEDVFGLDGGQLRSMRGTKVSFVPQSPSEAANPSLRIGSQLTETIKFHQNIEDAEARERAIALLTRVHLQDPDRLMASYPHQLSGGQLQRVMIAMALLNQPELLVMDEPTTGLDVTVEASVLDLLEELKSDLGIAILYVAHNLGVIARLCDRVCVMYAGEAVELGEADTIFHDPKHPYTVGLLRALPRPDRPLRKGDLQPIPGMVTPVRGEEQRCSFAARCALAMDRCRENHPPLYSVTDDHATRCLRWQDVQLEDEALAAPARDHPDDSVERLPRLIVDDLHAYYKPRHRTKGGDSGMVRAVDGVDFRVDEGRVVAVVGESGCGKSTLGSTVVGLRGASSGRIEFMGADVSKPVERRGRRVQRLLQMVFQDHGSTLNPSSRIGKITARPLELFGIVPRKEVQGEAIALLESVGLDPEMASRYPSQISGGQRQRVAVARAFASRPALVVCDEVTSALDVSVQAALLNLLLELQREQGTSLLFISHDLGVVRYLADEILVMYLGKIVESGSTDRIFSGPNHPYTEALLSAVPIPDPRVRPNRLRLEGSPPSAAAPPSGCRFNTRCPRKIGVICEQEEPPWREPIGGHRIRCHIPVDELPRSGFTTAPATPTATVQILDEATSPASGPAPAA